jgi:hypothetical protein
MVVFLLAGMQVLLFGFIGALLVVLRREIFRVQRRQGEMMLEIHRLESHANSEIAGTPETRKEVHVGH